MAKINIQNYPGYSINELGEVYNPKGKKLKPILRPDGYYAINLYIGKKSKKHLIHILCCKAFNGPKPKGKEVNHKDGIKANNRADNLEWATKSQNILHAYEKGLINPGKLGTPNNRHSAKLTQMDVDLLRVEFNVYGESKESLMIRYNIGRTQLNRIIKGTAWQEIA